MAIKLLDYKRILIITPDFSLNGANTVLLELMKLLRGAGREMTVMASSEGALSDRFKEMNVKCILKPTVLGDDIDYDEFDAVFLNTSSVHFYSLRFQNTDKPIFWWFHESPEQLNAQRDNFPYLALLSSNFHFLGVTPKVVRGLKDLYGVEAKLLPMAIEDVDASDEKDEEDKCLFFIPGAYTYIKGQDVLLQAISKLPPEFAGKSEFVFAGYKLPGQAEYYEKIKAFADNFSNVRLMDAISRKEVYEYYQKSDCVIAPSRIDSTPTTIVEAMMFGKICIVSSGAGMSEFMHDCVDGFVFPNDNVDELFKRLLLVISERDNLKSIAAQGRKIYENTFSPSAVLERLD